MTSHLDALDERLEHEIHAVLHQHLRSRRDLLDGIAPETATLVDTLERYLAGGKLLRPRICFWAGMTQLGDDADETELTALARMGAAIELIQAAALLHDDVIDRSDTRRGRPAAHVAAATEHRLRGLAGDPRQYGEAVAVLLGDLALSWAVELASPPGGYDSWPSLDPSAARHEFDLLRTEVMAGQYLDVLHQAGGYESAADERSAALSVIEWKTVPYTVLRPARIGAGLAGASPAALETLSAWARDLGVAFQLRDDLLGVLGDPALTGKPVGDDVREGKRTVLLALAREGTDEEGRTVLEDVVGRPDASEDQVQAARDVMMRSGAVAEVCEDVARRRRRARGTLEDSTELGDVGREGLLRLTVRATDLSDIPALSAT